MKNKRHTDTQKEWKFNSEWLNESEREIVRKQKVHNPMQHIRTEDKQFAKGTETCLLFTVHYSYFNKELPLQGFQKTESE